MFDLERDVNTFVRLIFTAAIAASPLASSQSANAAPLERPGLGRPSLGGKPSAQFVKDLNAIVAAQLAAKDQKDAGKLNPFSKPRPRPDREQVIWKRQ